MNLDIRYAVAEDYDEILALLEERRLWLKERQIVQWGANYVKKYNAEYFEQQQKEGNQLFVAFDNGKLAGCVLLKHADVAYWGESDGQAYYIHHFATRPGHAGLGTGMLDYVKEYAKANDIHYLRLDCSKSNEKLVSYYCEQGFEVIKEGADMFYKYNLLEHNLDE